MNQNNNREVVEISVEDIIPNRFQPRLTFDPEALNDLASSIKEHGIIQPLVVRRLQDKFEIIAGERRFKAASLIGLKTVPCIIMNLNDNESAEVAIIENIQRKEMTPLEEAKSFKKLLDKGYLTQEELAKRMGKSQSAISNKLRLLNLDEVVQEAILNGKISERHARSLLRVDNKEEQRKILAEIIEKRLTVKQTDELIKEKFGDANMEEHVDNENNIINNIFRKEPVNNSPVSESVQNMNLSTPTIKLPVEDSIEPNPQTNIMSNIGDPAKPTSEVNTTPNYGAPSPKDSLNIFRFDTEVPQNTEQELKSVISPSVFSNDDTNNANVPSTNNNINTNTSSIFSNINEQNMFKPVENNNISNMDSIVTLQDNQIINQDAQNQDNNLNSIFSNNNNSINLDINNIKNNAESINQPEKPTVDMSNLLKSSDKPINKFFVDLDIDPNQLNKLTLEPKIQNSVNTINRCIEDLKLQGINITKEEENKIDKYEIIIRIDK